MAPDHVLIGVDGSQNSRRAFEVGLAIAAKRQWALRIVWAYRMPYEGYPSGAPLTYERYRNDVVQEAEAFIAPLEALAEEAGVKVASVVVEDVVGRRLVHESRSAELAVVGKRGRNRFAGRFLGSVSSSLAAHSLCPTLIVPEKWVAGETGELVAPVQDRPGGEHADDEPTELLMESETPKPARRSFHNVLNTMNFDQEVVVGLDLDDSWASELVMHAAIYAEVLDNPLTLVTAEPLHNHLAPEIGARLAEDEITLMRRLFTHHLEQLAEKVSEKHPGLPVHWQFFDGTAGGVLSEASRTASMIIVGTRGHGGFGGLLLGSVSQTVLNRAVSPVLVVPSSRRQYIRR